MRRPCQEFDPHARGRQKTVPGAAFNKGKSKQDVGTPPEFIKAVEQRFGLLCVDLAATKKNKVCHLHVGPDAHDERFRDALAIDWKILHHRVRWLNPPFADITPWAKKCAECRSMSSWTLMLVPYSAGSNWWRDYVRRKAMIFALSPRIQFVGATAPYPKDLALCAYGFGVCGEDLWRWK